MCDFQNRCGQPESSSRRKIIINEYFDLHLFLFVSFTMVNVLKTLIVFRNYANILFRFIKITFKIYCYNFFLNLQFYIFWGLIFNTVSIFSMDRNSVLLSVLRAVLLLWCKLLKQDIIRKQPNGFHTFCDEIIIRHIVNDDVQCAERLNFH